MLLQLVIVILGIVILMLPLVRKFRKKRQAKKQVLNNHSKNEVTQINSNSVPKKSSLSVRAASQNLIEDSWGFYYQMRDWVKRKFSTTDQNLVHDLGRVMFNAGTKYIHVIYTGGIQERPRRRQTLVKEADGQGKVNL